MLQGVLKLMNAAIKISAEAVACSLIREVAMGRFSMPQSPDGRFRNVGLQSGFRFPSDREGA